MLTRVLVTLKHQLRVSRSRVPELDASIFGSTHHPIGIWRHCNAENEVLDYYQHILPNESANGLKLPYDLQKSSVACRPESFGLP